MLINLRKAHQLRSLAEARQAMLGSPIRVSIPLFAEDAARRASEALEKTKEEQQQAEKLEGIIQHLRTQIDKSNFESGINDILAEQGSLNRKLARLVKVSPLVPEPLDDLKARVAYSKERVSRSTREYDYGDNEVVWLSVTSEMVQLAKDEEVKVRRRLRTISEELMGKNYNTHITVSDADVSLLEKYNVV